MLAKNAAGILVGKPYAQELDRFPLTYTWSGQQDVTNLRRFLERWSGDYVAVVGSGGSYSAAKIIALFRELAHHAVTTPHTPLEFVSLLGRLSPRVLLLSAEGKNRDVLACVSASADADLAASAITLTASNPLIDAATSTGALRAFSFPMNWIKDGYLATNSLLAIVLLAYRVFFGDEAFDRLETLMTAERLRARRASFRQDRRIAALGERPLLVLYSAEAQPFAIDVVSKFVESALTPVHTTDLRQFAHGQHFLLASPTTGPHVVIAHSAAERELGIATGALLPATVQPIYVEIEGETPQDIAVAGLIEAMLFVEAAAQHVPHDIGQPEVPEFGRAIHRLDPRPLIPGRASEAHALAIAAKRKGHAGIGPSAKTTAALQSAAESYLSTLTTARIKAIVCDFDGTLCRAEERFGQMGSTLVTLISGLIRSGLKVAIATGRGGSLQDSLAAFDADLRPRITVGYYSGAVITTLDRPLIVPAGNPDFDALATWLDTTTYAGVCRPLVDSARGGQLTIHLHGTLTSAPLLAAVRGWLQQSGRSSWRAYGSGHSVDVLDADTSKKRVVDQIAAELGIDPLREILRIGDCGHEDGNDFELLSEGLSLSCDRVSTDLTRCWNFGRKGNNQAETTAMYLRSLVPVNDAFRLSETALFAHDNAAAP